jgi:hypothetical protein
LTKEFNVKRLLIVVTALGLLVTAAVAQDDVAITGFVDASYFYDANAGSGEFGLDQAEVDITHRASEKTVVRADLEWIKDGEDFVAQVEQAYMEYTCRAGATFTLGRFNAPIGFELVDPNEMYQFSHSLVYTYGLPVNLTGAMVRLDLGGGLDARAYGVNGWDVNAESNKVLTWGGRAGYSRGPGAVGISAITGKEADASGLEFNRTVFDVDLSCKPDGWVFGADVNSGKVETGGTDRTWFGFLVMAHRDFNDWCGLTVRYDYFDDQDGYAFGLVGGEAQTRTAVAFAPTFVLDKGFGALVEARLDMSDQDAFIDADGEAKDAALTLAAEMTYSW